MPVNITISHETPEGVIQHVRALAASFDHRPIPATAEPAPKLALSEVAKEAVAAVADAKAEPKRRGRPPKEGVVSNLPVGTEISVQKPQISTQPENRVDPEADAQDEADEAAESGNEDVFGASPPVRTLDDVRNLATAYQTKYGPVAVQEDGKKVLAQAAGVTLIRDIPVEKVSAAFEAMEKALNENPYKRAVVGL